MFKKFSRAVCVFALFYGFTSISLAVTDEQMTYIKELSEKINVPVESFLFDVESSDGEGKSMVTKKCALVPMQSINDHKECMKAMFGSKGDKDYIRYYLDGNLSDDKSVEKRVEYSVSRMNGDNPKSLTFIMTYGDESVGRIAVGPITRSDSCVPEVGYAIKKEYSGKGITKSSVECLLKIMQHMVDNEDKRYSFTRLRAVAKLDNKASNAILVGTGFKKSAKKIESSYGEKNEYFYEFGLEFEK